LAGSTPVSQRPCGQHVPVANQQIPENSRVRRRHRVFQQSCPRARLRLLRIGSEERVVATDVPWSLNSENRAPALKRMVAPPPPPPGIPRMFPLAGRNPRICGPAPDEVPMVWIRRLLGCSPASEVRLQGRFAFLEIPRITASAPDLRIGPHHLPTGGACPLGSSLRRRQNATKLDTGEPVSRQVG
jgi:hypothetical protein